MDQPVTRGSYAQVGGATYLVVQHDALEALPTFVGLPATSTSLPHRPPLVIRDDTNNLWIHTFAPATLLRRDVTNIQNTAPLDLLAVVETAISSILDLCTPRPGADADHLHQQRSRSFTGHVKDEPPTSDPQPNP